jgi:integrase
MEVTLAWAKASQLAKEQRLTDMQARRVIGDIHAIANRETLTQYSAEAFIKAWLENKLPSIAGSSVAAYEKASAEFIEHLGQRAKLPVEAITAKDVLAFRTAMSKRVSAGTTNQKLLIMRGCWTWGARLSLVTENPFKMVEMATGEATERRAFTVAELQELFKACNAEWRGMVLLGLYTGQRLGDLATVTWRQVDFEQREIKFLTQKTKRRQIIPLAKPLADYLLTLPSSDNPDSPVMPGIAATATNTLSRQFGELLKNAGLITRETSHRKRGTGRDARRVQSEITFHSLRHTATTLLKSAGVSDAIAQEIVGHDSTAISRGYTHIETSTLRKAVDLMGDVLKVTP